MTTTSETTRCIRCRRALRNATPDGYGPTCRRRIHKAAREMAEVTPHQVESAREALRDGAVIPLRGRVFLVVSTDGAQTYRTAVQACNCPAGLVGRMCWHRAAVAAVTTPPPARARRLAAADVQLAA